MKYLYILTMMLCLATLTACEKALLEETTEKVDDTSSDKNSNDKKSDKTDNDKSDADDDGSSDDPNSGSSDNKSDDNTSDGSANENDSIIYPDNGTSGSIEKDIVDGNEEKGNTDKPSSSNLTVQGEKAYTVTEFLANSYAYAIWVVGYIVGDCTINIKNANFTPPFSQPQAILLADDPNERDTSKMMSVQLSGDSRRNKYSLKAHPENQGKRLFAVCGYKRTYLGISGMKSEKSGISSMQWYDE